MDDKLRSKAALAPVAAESSGDDCAQDLPLKAVPEPSLRRLPSYVYYLRAIAQLGRDNVSTSHIGEALKLDPTQVRKDLAYTGIVGRPKVGYAVDELIEAIETFLGWNDITQAFLVGAGALGSALLGHQRLESCGLRLVAAFDNDPTKCGRVIHGKEVLPMEKLTSLTKRMRIHIGVLTLPADGAQRAADQLIAGGALALWNFAPTSLSVPPGIVVVDGELYSTLGLLKRGLSLALDKQP